MSEAKVEIRFNSKSSGQGVADALKIADKHEKSFDGKMCIVKFASTENKDIEKILKAVGSLKYTKVLVDGVEYPPRKVTRTLFCDKKLLCKGVCGSRLEAWMQHFQIPIVPAHASGHASGHIMLSEIVEIVEQLGPKYVLPVHTEHPEVFQKVLKNVQVMGKQIFEL